MIVIIYADNFRIYAWTKENIHINKYIEYKALSYVFDGGAKKP